MLRVVWYCMVWYLVEIRRWIFRTSNERFVGKSRKTGAWHHSLKKENEPYDGQTFNFSQLAFGFILTGLFFVEVTCNAPIRSQSRFCLRLCRGCLCTPTLFFRGSVQRDKFEREFDLDLCVRVLCSFDSHTKRDKTAPLPRHPLDSYSLIFKNKNNRV